MRLLLSATAVLVASTLARAGGPPPRLTQPGWLPANARALERLIAERGRSSATWDAHHRPVATFDWDNTMMRQDVGDLMLADALRRGTLRAPPGGQWSAVYAALSAAAQQSLARACGAAAERDGRLRTDKVPACADEILAVALDGRTRGGEPAYATPDTDALHHPYAFSAKVFWGQRHADVRAQAAAAHRAAENAPVGATMKVGSREAPAWVRIYPAMRELVAVLQAEGFDVWIVSASLQAAVEAVAADVGIAADHVVGVRLQAERDGRLLPRLESCGGAVDAVMTWGTGKRCHIQRAILGAPPAMQLQPSAGAQRVALAAGDTDGDVAMLQDAELRLVINRQKPAVLCRALANRDGRWLVQPMFLDPLPPRAEPYACAGVPDADGKPLPDVAEVVEPQRRVE
ncbi:MAG: haloacid dehalogenase-like hydrolase [Deltaproteobacteria bacterium]|nr:haloacid dehalogenase-like hydrolase [Deltaproteobacteria bacterium]